MERKPSGFWTKDQVVKDFMLGFVKGDADLNETAASLQRYCAGLGVAQPVEEIAADVRWYARAARRALGLPGLREAAAIAKAKADLEAQG